MISAREIASRQIRADEGEKFKLYRCTSGKLTIGIGRNLEDQGIDSVESNFLFQRDLDRVFLGLEKAKGFKELNEVRKAVIVNMTFQMGVGGVLQFRRMWAAIADQNFGLAADEMAASLWARQTPERAQRLIQQMRRGEI